MFRAILFVWCLTALAVITTVCSEGGAENPEPPYAADVILEPGLVGREDIIFFEDFETESWKDRWPFHWGAWDDESAAALTEPFAGVRCLSSESITGEHNSVGHGEYILSEPRNNIHMRLYLRLEPGFRMGTCNQLKLFGCTAATSLDNCYGGAGERPDGTKFYINMALSNSLELHFYYYHLNQNDNYGDWTYADKEGRVKILPGHWYSIECLVKANDIGQANGEMKCWVNGQLRGDVGDLTFRSDQTAGIRRLTIINYYGGAGPENTAPRKQNLYLDNVVYAREYIGPYQSE
jgi:hypothetical protein